MYGMSRDNYLNQFPALIYVDGKFYPEAEYQKVFLGITSEDRKTAKEATKKPPIDPLTRPRNFHFSFKVDVKDRPEQVGVIRTDSAKGMDEAEAWAKVFKRERNSGYYERVYDQEVTAIYAWNGVPLWRKGQGMITQPVRARRSHRIRIVQPGRSSSGVSTIR